MHQSRSLPINQTGRYAFAALIISNLFLAVGPWMVRLSDVGSVAAGFWRLALAIPLLLLFARMTDKQSFRPGWAIGAMIVIGGLFFAADLAAWHTGIKLTKLANATLFGNSSSFLFAAYGFIAARMLPRGMQTLALILAGLGAALLLGSSYELSARPLRGDLFAILAGLFYTFYLIAIDQARRTLKPMPVLALATAAGALPLLLLAFVLGEQIIPGAWTPLILLSLGSQVVGQGLLVYAMGHLSPVVVGLGMLTQPAVTAMIGWLAYDERLSLTDGAGALLICAALVLIRLPGGSGKQA
ncbi:MAG: DMT family transporter [Sphingosinicella sp.]|nr:DMT family transporter [Sphingosinicella sp.]